MEIKCIPDPLYTTTPSHKQCLREAKENLEKTWFWFQKVSEYEAEEEGFGGCDYLSDICASLMEEKCLAESQRLSLQETCAKNHILELQGNHSKSNRKQKMKKVFHFTVH